MRRLLLLVVILGPTGLAAPGRAAAPPAAEPRSFSTRVRSERPRKEPVTTTVRAEEAARLAGTQGDVLKVVESLPGVGRSALGAGQLILWGASPAESRVLVDGVEIPALYHFGGWRSTVTPELVRSVELVPGAFGPDYGRSLGGLVRVTTRDGREEGAPGVPSVPRVHSTLALDFLDASASLSAAVGERFQVSASGRYGYLDRLAALVLPGALDLFPIPRYADAQFRLRLRLGEGETLRATFLYADDRLTRTQPSPDPASVRRERLERSFYRVYLDYTRVSAEGGQVTLVPFFGVDRERRRTAFGPVPTRLDRDALIYGVRASYRRRLHERVVASIGLDLRGERTRLGRAGSLTLPPREGDPYVFGQAPGADVNSDEWTTHIADLGPYVQAEITLGPVRLVPGLRLDAFLIEGSRLTPRIGDTPPIGFTRIAWALGPRLTALWRLGERLTLVAGAGSYAQPPAPEDLSAVFGNPALGPTSAVHATAGATLRLIAQLTIEASGYYRRSSRQVSRASASTPPLAGALDQDGSGRSYGAQLVVRHEPWRGFAGWIAYTVGRSERRDHAGGPLRLSDYDQTHLLTVLAGFRRRGWDASARLRYATGLPRTPVTGAFFDVQSGEYQPLFGERNSTRLPDFVQLDLRLGKSLTLGRVGLELYLEVQNVTYRRNAEEVIYSRDFRQRDYITGLPTLAIAGARMQL